MALGTTGEFFFSDTRQSAAGSGLQFVAEARAAVGARLKRDVGRTDSHAGMLAGAVEGDTQMVGWLLRTDENEPFEGFIDTRSGGIEHHPILLGRKPLHGFAIV